MELAYAIWTLTFFVVLRFVHRLLWGSRQSQRLRRQPGDVFQQGTQFKSNSIRRPMREISGKAYVTDGDGLRVNNVEIRIAGLDAPEYDQIAKHNGRWFNFGRIVKSALIQEIGGKEVSVRIKEYDKFGRAIGTVRCNGRDIGAYLVKQGMAVSAYDKMYKEEENEARRLRRGQWQFEESFDPRWWRNKKEK